MNEHNLNEPTPNPEATTNEQGGERIITEEYKISGEAVVSKVKELVREGNVRRITISNEEGRTLIEIPLAIGVVGAILLPVWAAIGAIAALVANLTIKVERKQDEGLGSTEVIQPGGDYTP